LAKLAKRNGIAEVVARGLNGARLRESSEHHSTKADRYGVTSAASELVMLRMFALPDVTEPPAATATPSARHKPLR